MMPVPAPPTPVLLYLGAGYDLSPLISFAPDPPYAIAPPSDAATAPRTTYTSFLFVDAKPRHTSAFMVPDFDQWIDAPARVRNVLRYAQGMLDRWRIVDDDVIWFEGGGDPAPRAADPAWHVPTPAAPHPTPHPAPAPRPLTTLLYAFNTLDIELARAPALAHALPAVAALYVHGLRPHARTGLATPALAHVYVLPGSWGTRRRPGARHVDFIRAARARHAATPAAPDAALRSASSLSLPHSDADSDAEHSPLVFRRRAWWDSDSDTDTDADSADPAHDAVYGAQTPGLTTASTLVGEHAPAPFFTRIPQVAWDAARGRYVVRVSVADSLKVWRARSGACETEVEESDGEDEDEEGAGRESAGDEDGDAVRREKAPHRRPRTAPPRLRLRPRPPHTHPKPHHTHTHTPASAHPRPRALSPALSSASSSSSSSPPRRRPFWRRAPPRERERRIDMADFLRGARSCPDLVGAVAAEEDSPGRGGGRGRQKGRTSPRGGRQPAEKGGGGEDDTRGKTRTSARGLGALRALGAFAGLGRRGRGCRCGGGRCAVCVSVRA